MAPTIATQRKQAMLPAGCRILGNSEGTAPGFLFELAGVSWFFMPGVPKEMKAMFLAEVLSKIPVVEGYRSFNWATQFTSEGELQQRLREITRALPSDFEISYRTRFPENHIGLHGICGKATLSDRFDESVAKISGLLGHDVFSAGQLLPLEQVVAELLRRKAAIMATVESCTGGLVANRITDVPGSSEVFWSAWVTYDNRAKIDLGVPERLIETHGAVSAEVAMALASAGLKKLKALGAAHSICVATTGIAGPTGGSAEKPVGLCFVAIARDGHPPEAEEVRSRIGLRRNENKLFFSQKALELVRRSLL
jgi:nicotinamide-nucleotide amidase